MQITIDSPSQQIVLGLANVRPAASFSTKASAAQTLLIQFGADGLPEASVATREIYIQLRELGKYDGPKLGEASAFVAVAGAPGLYQAALAFTPALLPLLGRDGAAGNDKASVATMIEVAWRDQPGDELTRTINSPQVLVANWIVDEAEISPADPLNAYVYNLPTITGLTGGAGKLDGLPTLSRPLHQLVVLTIAGQEYSYRLMSGIDAAAAPDIIRPLDFALGTNEKIWRAVSASSFPHTARVESNGDNTTASVGGQPYLTAQAAYDAIAPVCFANPTQRYVLYQGVGNGGGITVPSGTSIPENLLFTGVSSAVSKLGGITCAPGADGLPYIDPTEENPAGFMGTEGEAGVSSTIFATRVDLGPAVGASGGNTPYSGQSAGDAGNLAITSFGDVRVTTVIPGEGGYCSANLNGSPGGITLTGDMEVGDIVWNNTSSTYNNYFLMINPGVRFHNITVTVGGMTENGAAIYLNGCLGNVITLSGLDSELRLASTRLAGYTTANPDRVYDLSIAYQPCNLITRKDTTGNPSSNVIG